MCGYNDVILLKNPTLGKHSVTKFEVPNACVHCTDGPDGNFVTECLLKIETFFLDEYGIRSMNTIALNERNCNLLMERKQLPVQCIITIHVPRDSPPCFNAYFKLQTIKVNAIQKWLVYE